MLKFLSEAVSSASTRDKMVKLSLRERFLALGTSTITLREGGRIFTQTGLIIIIRYKRRLSIPKETKL